VIDNGWNVSVWPKAARKLVEIASTIEAVQDGRIYIELVNAGFIRQHGGAGRSSA
jgi:hypothetical protein